MISYLNRQLKAVETADFTATLDEAAFRAVFGVAQQAAAPDGEAQTAETFKADIYQELEVITDFCPTTYTLLTEVIADGWEEFPPETPINNIS